MFSRISKFLHRANPLEAISTESQRDPLYVSRPSIEAAISSAITRGENLVVYGPSYQGKTTLLSRQLAGIDYIYIECRPDFKRTQIYRVALSSLGYALLVQKTKRGKASTTVNLGVASTGINATVDGELEQVMQAVTIDLKNPTEVAHLISRMKNRPWLVLNNFQLLDTGTKRKLLLDFAFFSERPSIRMLIVGAWPQEEYLEDIEPSIAGKFTYVSVPLWNDSELRRAAKHWAGRSEHGHEALNHLDDFLSLAGGDVSLMRTFIEGARHTELSAVASVPGSASSMLPIQTMVIGRFRRGLNSKIMAIFAQKGNYVTYSALKSTGKLIINPHFRRIPNTSEDQYVKTSIDPISGDSYPNNRQVLLDSDGNPQYLVEKSSETEVFSTEVVRFLFRAFHSAAQQNTKSIELVDLVREFQEQLSPKPVAIDEVKLRTVFVRFDEVQRQSLIVPSLLAVGTTGTSMEIVDRRLFLFLQSINLEDLEELFDSLQPRNTPSAPRRNHLSPPRSDEDEEALIAQAVPQSTQDSGEHDSDSQAADQGDPQEAVSDEGKDSEEQVEDKDEGTDQPSVN